MPRQQGPDVSQSVARFKENRGFRRFMRRGLAAADSEAGLIFAAHNLLKVFHHNPGVVFSAT
ncbi:MAG: transposase [Acidimicrobiales bacterium]